MLPKNHLEVTLTAGCPMMCSYCPQTNFIKGFKALNTAKRNFMSFDDYQVILANVDHHVPHVYFTGFTEPIGHKEWYKFVEYTKQQNYKVTFNTTFYSATKETIDTLIDLDVDVEVHITDSKIEIPEEIYVYFAEKYKKRSMPIFNVFTQKGVSRIPQNIQAFGHRPNSRADNLDHIPRAVYDVPVRCQENRFFSNVVMPNGDVSVCCSDFSVKHILGNLLTTKLKDIHKSEAIKQFLRKMNEGDPTFICNNCHYASPVTK